MRNTSLYLPVTEGSDNAAFLFIYHRVVVNSLSWRISHTQYKPLCPGRGRPARTRCEWFVVTL